LLSAILESNEGETLLLIAARELERIREGVSATEYYESKVSVSVEISVDPPEEFGDALNAVVEEMGEEIIRQLDTGEQEGQTTGVPSDDFGGSISGGRGFDEPSTYDEYHNTFVS